jgi:DNA-directed RNA polymerase subunit beta'
MAGEVAAEHIIDPETADTIVTAGTDISEKLARRIAEAHVGEVVLRKTHLVPHRGKLNVEVGDQVRPGDRLTEGPLDPQKVLELQGVHGVMDYLVSEIQSVYKSQGVDINDKHIEIIVRQMLKRRRINEAGDTKFLPGQIVDKFDFEDENTRVREQGGTEATADWVLLGITEASLATDSFLSAASFQKTTRVLTEAAVKGKRDNLLGLKENVIIGRLIPAGTGLPRYRALDVLGEGNEPILTVRDLLEPPRLDADLFELTAPDDYEAEEPEASEAEEPADTADAEGPRLFADEAAEIEASAPEPEAKAAAQPEAEAEPTEEGPESAA